MTPTELITFATQRYPSILAQNTIKNYLAVARRAATWAQQQNIQDLWAPTTWSGWIASTNAQPQGRLSYNKCCTAIISLRALIIDAPLKLQRRSLLGLGALTPIKQATPILRTFLDHPDLRPHRLAVLIAWKTASRWDEVLRLSRSSCTILPETVTDPARILIDWDNRTKASRTNPHRASRWTIIEGPFTDEISAKLLPLAPTAPITLLSTAQIDRILLPHGYSAHSFKAGAMNHITRQLPPGQDSEVLLARLAKHQHLLDPTAVTLG
jgi:hypothetical protein